MSKNILSKPKVFVPVFTVIMAGLAVFFYGRVSNPPAVPASLKASDDALALDSGKDISLAFPKAGRVESVLVKVGDTVKAGETLATLFAPDAKGAVAAAKGALDLALAQYSSLNKEYETTKAQQDLLVQNAYNTLLSAGLEGTPSIQDQNTPVITGTYTCGKEGSYILKTYASGDYNSGYSVNYSGLESGSIPVTYDNSIPLGDCGLQIKFNHLGNFNPLTVWTIDIPNTKSSVYLSNRNAYDLAINTREKVLSDLAVQIGEEGSGSSVAQAQIDAAKGAYEAAQGAYQNDLIVAPADGTVTFVDQDLKPGQSVVSGKTVISISSK